MRKGANKMVLYSLFLLILTWAGCQVHSCHREAPCSPPPGPGWGPSHQLHVALDSVLQQNMAENNTPGPGKIHRTGHIPHTTVAPTERERRWMSELMDNKVMWLWLCIKRHINWEKQMKVQSSQCQLHCRISSTNVLTRILFDQSTSVCFGNVFIMWIVLVYWLIFIIYCMSVSKMTVNDLRAVSCLVMCMHIPVHMHRLRTNQGQHISPWS